MTRGERFCYEQANQWLTYMRLTPKYLDFDEHPKLGLPYGIDRKYVIDLISGLLTYDWRFADKLRNQEAFTVKLNVFPSYNRNGKLLSFVVQRPQFSDIPKTEISECQTTTPKETRAE